MRRIPSSLAAFNRVVRVCLIVGLVVSVIAVPSPGATADVPPPVVAGPANLLSLTAGGHVLGFGAEGVYVASGDHLLMIEFVGAAGVRPVGEQPPTDGLAATSLPDRLGLRDRVGLTSSPPLGKVTYANLWTGISLTYETIADGIAKSTYFVAPGGSVDDIRLRYNVPVQLAEDGSLVFAFDSGKMRESAPVAWQEIDGEQVAVDAAFRLLGEREVGFAVGDYDGRYPLVVDPELAWNSFVGGSGNDYNNYAIAVDDDGNVYVSGDSSATWGSPVRSYTSSTDGFVARLGADGSLLWNTFLGGSDEDRAFAIALDDSNNVYVAGDSRATWGSPVRAYTSGTDAFAAKLDSSGNLLWHSFLGSSVDDSGYALAADSSGNAYVGGYSRASWGSPVRGYSGSLDALVAKLDTNGNLSWHTFLGGSGIDYALDIAVDGNGNVLITGPSGDNWGSPIRSFTANNDAFVAKLNSSGALQWNTFLGGAGYDYGFGIAADGSGNVFVTGYSGDNWGSPVRSFTALIDPFVAKLNGSGALQWNTFLGGAGNDYGYGVALDGSGNVLVTGGSSATWGSPDRAYTSGDDSFAARVDGSGNLTWSTFLGGSGNDVGRAIAVDDSQNIYVGGRGDATWGSPVRSYTAGWDYFAAKLSNAVTYADPAGACASNTPCLTTLPRALGGLLTGGTTYVYGGAYTQSLSISTNVTATLTATVAITGSVSLTTGTLNTNGYTLTVSGDWSNTGGAYNANSGRVIFDKDGTATLSKSGAGSTETFCNLTISLTTTILDVSDDYLAIADGCSLTNNGAIRREAPAQNATNNTRLAYDDPLGLPTVALTSTGGTALGSTAITVTIGQTPPSCNGSAFAGTPLKRFYQVTPAQTSGVSGTLRLYYDPDEANGTTASNVNIFHCGTSGGWQQIAGTAIRGTDENANKYVEVANVSTFSPFTLGEGSPTGVEVSSLAARALSSGIEVSWETANELNILGFDLWRAEGGSGDWLKVNEARLMAEGGSWGNRYRCVDAAARPGRRYQYRVEALRLLGGSEWYGPVWGTRGWTIFLPFVSR